MGILEFEKHLLDRTHPWGRNPEARTLKDFGYGFLGQYDRQNAGRERRFVAQGW
jgi:hypothetical protein